MTTPRKTFGRRTVLRGGLAAAAGLVCSPALISVARAQAPIKIGILHSLSGTMAISETTLKEA
jgi:urea transport system substrate-binding protein